jgi:hypothetical protein
VDRPRARRRPRPRLVRRVTSLEIEMLTAIGMGLFVYVDACQINTGPRAYPARLEDEDDDDMAQRPLLAPRF